MDRNHIDAIIKKMTAEGLPSVVIDTFIFYYTQVVNGETGIIYDSEITPIEQHELKDISELKGYQDIGREAVKHSVMIVLNGGLGTSMGLTGPKSLLEAKNGKSFLEIILEQSSQQGVTLLLMNSFNTHQATCDAIRRMKRFQEPLMFLQHKYPKIYQKDYSLARCDQHPELEWNPPGHGDIYTALLTSGMLDHLLEKNIQYAFIRNSDNLGASMDYSLLGYFVQNQFPFMMETAQRTPADMKGGHLARLKKNGRFILREAAQCPEEELDAFKDISKYRFFNTNNLWVNLRFLKDYFKNEQTIQLPLIRNPKKLDPRNEFSEPVFQIETAMGAAISIFEGATAVKVSRNRFFPVKKCNDLLILRSDCFIFSDDGQLIQNPDRSYNDLPKVDLDPLYYGMIDSFNERFSSQVPSLIKCEYLKIEGAVRFEDNVKLIGKVIIKNQKPYQAVISQGSVLTGEVYL